MGYRDWNTIFRTTIFFITNLMSLYCIWGYVRKGRKKRWYKMLKRAKWHVADEILIAGLLISMFCQALYMNYTLIEQDPVWDLLIVYGLHWMMLVIYGYLFFIRQKLAATLVLIPTKGILLGFLAVNFIFDAEWSTLYLIPYFLWTVYFYAINIYITDNNSEKEQKPILELRISDFTGNTMM